MSSARNIYQDGVDFSVLALQSSSFAKFLKPNSQLDFSDPEAVHLNYILWVQDLLDTTSDKYIDRYDASREVVGLDIGTGASCIYPLLGCVQRPKWRFAATDIDDNSLQTAQKNVENNKFQSRVRLVKTSIEDALIPLGSIGIDGIDFTMCNPPFYASKEEMISSANDKQRPPFSACTGAEVEMVTTGGEVAFVQRMIRESLDLRERVEWYSTMLGKLSSVFTTVERLREIGIENYAVTEFVQGSKTRRWAIAWSWGDMRPSMVRRSKVLSLNESQLMRHVDQSVARGLSSLPKSLLPFPSESTLTLSSASIDTTGQQINAVLKSLNLQWQWKQSMATGVGFAEGNVWSRASRRKHKISGDAAEEEDEDANEVNFGFKIQVKAEKGSADVKILIRWLKGNDSVLFESFCGMLKRKVTSETLRDLG
ncbi:MAG: hypothetical protein M1837_002237 [Sclerophora amabilis]|nr:MAG: hypothetical protein M1837_002237 [Sclerophora amabilis]